MDVPPPVLVTSRLRLTPLAEGDLPPLLLQWNTPEVGRFLWDGLAVSAPTATAVREASDRSFSTAGYGLWTLRMPDSSAPEPLGFCGLRLADENPAPEVLYALARPVWGRGLALEATRAVLDYSFEKLGLPRVRAGANPANPASWRILERLGFVRQGLVRTAVEDLYTYAVTRAEWSRPAGATAAVEESE